MKYLVTAAAADKTAGVDERFGRAPWFMVFDDKTGEWSAHANASGNAVQGAGIQAAQTVVNLGVNVVITGAVGPKARQVLEPAGIRIVEVKGIQVGEALKYCRDLK